MKGEAKRVFYLLSQDLISKFERVFTPSRSTTNMGIKDIRGNRYRTAKRGHQTSKNNEENVERVRKKFLEVTEKSA